MAPFSLIERARVYSDERIMYPMKRVDFDPNGERNPQVKGVLEQVVVLGVAEAPEEAPGNPEHYDLLEDALPRFCGLASAGPGGT